MVEVGIVVSDAASARRLVERLRNVFDATSVSLDDAEKEVRVQAGDRASQAVIEVLWTVSRWFDQGGNSTAELRLGDRSHTLGGSDGKMRISSRALA